MSLGSKSARWLAGAAVLLTAGATTAVVSAMPSPAAAAPAGGVTYLLAAKSSGRCIDVPSASLDNGAQLQQWGCHADQAWQQFTVKAQANGQFNLVNVNSTRCVDVPSGAATVGLRLQQWGCGDGTKPAQLFTFPASGTDTYQIRNVASGLCAAVSGTDNGAAVVQQTCAATTSQQWTFTSLSGGGPGNWSNAPDGFASTGGTTTGGAGGTAVTATNFADLVRYATASAAYVIRVSGTITVTPYGHEIPVASNKTIVGVGTGGRIKNGGFFLGTGVRNVIIRNLTIGDTAMASDDPDDKDFDYDGIQMDTADHVWIDHNTFTNINDGYIDSRKDTNYVTVSWNRMGDHNKTFGIGWTENVIARMTIHHNWIFNSNQRNPSADNLLYAHLYNNYLSNVASYGNYARGATKMVIENSYFEKVNDPFSPDTANGAQLRQSGSILVSCTGAQATSGSAFTPGSFYSYTLDPAASVPGLVRTYAGPQANISM